MASESIKITRMKCDRCGETEDNPESGWAKLTTQMQNGGCGKIGYSRDICGHCYAALVAWFDVCIN